MFGGGGYVQSPAYRDEHTAPRCVHTGRRTNGESNYWPTTLTDVDDDDDDDDGSSCQTFYTIDRHRASFLTAHARFHRIGETNSVYSGLGSDVERDIGPYR